MEDARPGYMMNLPLRFALVLACLLAPTGAWAGPVLMISIDGLRPDYVTHADRYGLKIPTLRRFLGLGSYAEGVVGVVPTVTYPSHTTLVTGVWPTEHGIHANGKFDPFNPGQDEWYWYASEIKSPTLWEAASKAGKVTASVSWPVTVDAKWVKYAIPEFWRAKMPENLKLLDAISNPPGWLDDVSASLGLDEETVSGAFEAARNRTNPEAIAADEVRTKLALKILADEKPGFMTVHLGSLDHVEHSTGPFSKESDAALEQIDEMVDRLCRTALANDPATVIAVVSDHGFLPVENQINLAVSFVGEGLIKLKTQGGPSDRPQIASWDAAQWSSGGSAAVMLRDPQDAALRTRVRNFLQKLKDDPTLEIARVVEQPELSAMGGFPEAAFLVEMKPGADVGGNLTGPVVQAAPGTGAHGYLPDRPELRASLFIMGKGIASGRNLGLIDMRQVAPTVAMILGVNMPTAKSEKLHVMR
jgi:predicted AlkP superfamily pyrophosphatase or phosphodiesterase